MIFSKIPDTRVTSLKMSVQLIVLEVRVKRKQFRKLSI